MAMNYSSCRHPICRLALSCATIVQECLVRSFSTTATFICQQRHFSLHETECLVRSFSTTATFICQQRHFSLHETECLVISFSTTATFICQQRHFSLHEAERNKCTECLVGSFSTTATFICQQRHFSLHEAERNKCTQEMLAAGIHRDNGNELLKLYGDTSTCRLALSCVTIVQECLVRSFSTTATFICQQRHFSLHEAERNKCTQEMLAAGIHRDNGNELLKLYGDTSTCRLALSWVTIVQECLVRSFSTTATFICQQRHFSLHEAERNKCTVTVSSKRCSQLAYTETIAMNYSSCMETLLPADSLCPVLQ
ncbi:hypothetical protein J6590_044234 [Homalodisca vitripennis]|nr:hypothetical protein J6590_044234 [Homalodisca vitripennis]